MHLLPEGGRTRVPVDRGRGDDLVRGPARAGEHVLHEHAADRAGRDDGDGAERHPLPPVATATATAADRAPGGGVLVGLRPLDGAGEGGGHRLVGEVEVGEVVERRVLDPVARLGRGRREQCRAAGALAGGQHIRGRPAQALDARLAEGRHVEPGVVDVKIDDAHVEARLRPFPGPAAAVLPTRSKSEYPERTGASPNPSLP